MNKAEVVALDEKEGGVRATLNLGHTFGHAIETGIGYGEWLHGEAVSVGMVMAADMSERLGWIDESVARRTLDLLKKFDLPDGRPGAHDRGGVREAHGRGQESREREAQADSAQGRPRRVRVHRRLRRAGARRDAGASASHAEVTTRVCDLTGL